MGRWVLAARIALAAVCFTAPRAVAQTPAGCRPDCGHAKSACIGQAKDDLRTALGTCAAGPAPRKLCRRHAKMAAKDERHACRDFASGCRACCTAGGPDCAVGCGDGVVAPERGE